MTNDERRLSEMKVESKTKVNEPENPLVSDLQKIVGVRQLSDSDLNSFTFLLLTGFILS